MDGHEGEPLPVALDQHAAELRDISLDELTSGFAPQDVIALGEYQAGKSADSLADQPLSEEFIAKYPEACTKLGNNTSTYEDVIEEAFFEDRLVIELVRLRRERPKDTALTGALRTRRSVLVLLLNTLKGSKSGI